MVPARVRVAGEKNKWTLGQVELKAPPGKPSAVLSFREFMRTMGPVMRHKFPDDVYDLNTFVYVHYQGKRVPKHPACMQMKS